MTASRPRRPVRSPTRWCRTPATVSRSGPNEPDPRRGVAAGHDLAFARSCPDETFDLLCELRRPVGEPEAVGYTGALAVGAAAGMMAR